ncbi:MAG: bifunctional folylpolyglutamate synthase/dihydrofolate synthase [Alphaproteobacteria bacterium]|nr:bifunctional folylpolyglutamate synthase/dihydrofolate synthase [Alphaproteobacteria bacterium]
MSRAEAIIERLHGLYPKLIDLSLERLERLLAALGNPERRLPPIIHVAGTNGKGSTCAFLRAIGEAAGLRVHVYTSPHLVRFNERIRLAGSLVSDEVLADALAEVEQVNAGQPITVFEVLMAASFVLFARVPADLCVLEVGLGGRADATNVIAAPAACAITSISLDHREMLGDTIALIAREKAGIMKPGVPVVTGTQPDEAFAVLRAHAAEIGAPLLHRDADWQMARRDTGLVYRDAGGTLTLPPPSLLGPHQIDNAGIAVAALRASGLRIPDGAYARGLATATWPARLQRLTGHLAHSLPAGWELWLDGGHNPGGGQALAEHAASWSDRPLHVLVGMKQAKDSAEFLRPLIPHATTLWAVSEPGQHLALPVGAIIAASDGIARPGPTIAAAIAQLPPGPPARVLICGSLYLAGEVLKADGWVGV